MTINYHNDSFDLLKIGKRFTTDSQQHSEKELIIDELLPESVKEFIKLHEFYNWYWKNKWSTKTHELLEFYSNNDLFWITTLNISEKIIDEKTGKSLIEFGQENQGNFLLAFEFDTNNPDPSVYINDSSNNWNLYFQTFSDFVYCQIFEWQFKLGFLPGWETELGYYETSDLSSPEEILLLREKFKEGPSNEYIWEDHSIRITRFYNSDSERVIAYEVNDKISIEVFGIDHSITKQFFKKVMKILDIK